MSLIGKSIGNYQIKAKLGEGGMGTVYLGEHPLIGKRVAVKVLLEELSSKEDIVQRFFNEAKAVNDIGHQNIVDIVDFGKMKSDTGAAATAPKYATAPGLCRYFCGSPSAMPNSSID